MQAEFIDWVLEQSREMQLVWSLPACAYERRVCMEFLEVQMRAVLDFIRIGEYRDLDEALADDWNLTRDEQDLIRHNIARWYRQWQEQQEANHENTDRSVD